MDAARTWAESVAIAGGRIVAVGTDRDIAARIGPKTKVIALGGRMVLPGFHDAHVHPMAGIHDQECQLGECGTADQAREAIRKYVEGEPGEALDPRTGLGVPLFPDGNPHRSVIDEIVPDRPAYFVANDGHSAWVNSKALAVAGITKDTPDPPNGHIERDAKTGEPTGTLREDAMGLVSQASAQGDRRGAGRGAPPGARRRTRGSASPRSRRPTPATRRSRPTPSSIARAT